MQEYICINCDNLKCSTSICPICHSRTIPVKSTIYWCEYCGAPIYSDTCNICGLKCKPLAVDIRPVFPEERLLIEIILGEPMKYKDCSCFSAGSSIHYKGSWVL